MIIRHPIGLAQLVGWFFLLLATVGSSFAAWALIHLYAGPDTVVFLIIAVLGLKLVAIDEEEHEIARLLFISVVTLTLVPIGILLIAALF